MGECQEAWAGLRPKRQVLQSAPVTQWAAGRQAYAVWLAFVTEPSVLDRLTGFTEELGPLLRPGYIRQPHITLAAAGFPVVHARGPDDYAMETFHGHLRALANLALPPFSVEVGGANSFEVAPYLEVADPTRGLATLQSTLCTWTQAGKPFRFIPHITAGLYREGAAEAEIQRVLARHRNQAPLRCAVRCLTLAVYDPRELGGVLMPMHQVDLQ